MHFLSAWAFCLVSFCPGVCERVETSFVSTALSQYPCNTNQSSLSQWCNKISCLRAELVICKGSGRMIFFHVQLARYWMHFALWWTRLRAVFTSAKRWKRKIPPSSMSHWKCCSCLLGQSHCSFCIQERIALKQGSWVSFSFQLADWVSATTIWFISSENVFKYWCYQALLVSSPGISKSKIFLTQTDIEV